MAWRQERASMVGRGHALRSARRMSLWEAIVELGGGEGRLGSGGGGGDAGARRESTTRTRTV
jgi:hypothetical protein